MSNKDRKPRADSLGRHEADPASTGRDSDAGSTIDGTEPRYVVGYCRPPVNTRFRAGRSGNPRGRPASAKGLKTIVREAVQEKVRVKLGARHVNRTKLEVTIQQLANNAARGDLKATEALIRLCQNVLTDEDTQRNEEPLTDTELLAWKLANDRSS